MKNIALSIPAFNTEDEEALVSCLRTGWVMQGPRVREFEELFADFVGAKYAVAVTSCTTALHLALLVLGIGPGDEVIVPSFSWVATANAVEFVGATVKFVDVDETFNLNLDEIESAISPQTKAIIPVHLFGLCVNVAAIQDKFPDLLIVEDAACAAGSSLNGRKAGAMGEMAAFSFHPRKSITTGEGGMVTTQNESYYKQLLELRNHGLAHDFVKKGNQDMPEVNVLGYNFRMTDIQASIGVTQMKRLASMIEERNAGAQVYYNRLSGIEGLTLPPQGEHIVHCWQSFVILVDDRYSRNEVMKQLADQGIATRPGTQAVHSLGFYQEKYGLAADALPMSMQVYEQSIAIPMHNKMSSEDFEYVAETLAEILKG